MKPERRLQLQVSEFLKMQYPDVIFWSNDSGEKKPMGLAVLNKRMRSGSKIPDLWISEARGGFFGLYIELKTESPLRKNGLPKSEHVIRQAEMIDRLNERGYMACFGVGLESTMATIRMYLSQLPTVGTQPELIKGSGNPLNEPKGVFTFSQPKTETK